jgi:hypothetical protein
MMDRNYINAEFVINGWTYRVCVACVEYDQDMNIQFKVFTDANGIQENLKAQVKGMEEWLSKQSKFLPKEE